MRIVYHCADEVGAEMAGPGIRAVELSRRLAAVHEVTLVASGAASLRGEPFTAVEYTASALRAATRAANALVTQGFGFPLSIAVRFRGRLVLDLYDPVQLEQLAQFGPAATPEQRISLAHVRARLLLLLRRADHVLCASPLQRALWLGWLGAAGRLAPEVLGGDPEARALLAVVPFGVPEEPPRPGDRPLRRLLGLGPDARIALWGGGLWDWMDPQLAVRAAARLRDGGADLHLVFLAGARPGNVAPMRVAADAARRAVADLGLDGRVHFVERWIPYAERGGLLLDADLAVSAHRPTLEAELAFRTRLLDCLWARLPVACTGGDALASEAERDGWGACATTGDEEGLARAMAAMLDPAANARARDAAGRAAPRRHWRVSASTLLDLFVRPAPPRPAGVIPGELAGERPARVAGAMAAKVWRRLRRAGGA